jgi:hypothetical protein
MNVHTVPRAAVTTSLALIRAPLDAAAGLLPGESSGPQGRAKLALDRADARVRGFAAAVTFDPALHEDARRRKAAVMERERAARLRGKAEQTTETARGRAEQRHEQATRRRRQATSQAKAKRQQATRRREQREEKAEKTEQERLETSREVEAQREQQIEQEAPKERLEAVEAAAEAQHEHEEALTEADEARRLAEAASGIKEDRKEP